MSIDVKKLWFKSRTILFNIAAIGAVAVQVGAVGTLIPLEYQLTALALANLVLRYLTNAGITSPSATDVADAATAVKGAATAVKNVITRQ